MYYSAGTYEAFAHPEKPKDVAIVSPQAAFFHTCLPCGFERSGYVIEHNAVFGRYAERFCGIEIYVGVLFAFAENGGGAYRFKHSPQSCVMKHGSVKLGGL